MKAIFYFIVFFLIASSNVFAQPDSVEIYDLTIVNDFKRNDSGDPTEIIVSTLFKINHPDKVAEVYIKLGSTKDGGEIKLANYPMVLQNATYYLMDNGVTNKVWGKSAVCKYSLSISEWKNLQWVSVFTKNKSGVFSEIKYHKYK